MKEEKYELKKLSEESAEYRASRGLSGENFSVPHAFGEDTLYSIDRPVRKLPRVVLEKVPETELENSRSEMKRILNNKITYVAAMDFIRESLEDEDFNSDLQKASETTPGLKNFLTQDDIDKKSLDIATALKEGLLPDKLYEKMLRIHLKNFEKRKKFVAEKIPDLMKSFKLRVEEGMRRGELPITHELLESRIKETVFSIGDFLSMGQKGALAEYSVGGAQIIFSDRRIDEDSIDKSFTHEMLHVLSGRTIGIWKTENPPDHPDPTVEKHKIAHQRTGVHFTDFETPLFGHAIPNEKFRWLNEAVTESLALWLTGSENKTYHDERFLLVLLMTQGKNKIDKKLFYEAYFENYDPNAKEKVPAWKKLIAAINESYSPAFLANLDKYIEKEGVKNAIELLKSKDEVAFLQSLK